MRVEDTYCCAGVEKSRKKRIYLVQEHLNRERERFWFLHSLVFMIWNERGDGTWEQGRKKNKETISAPFTFFLICRKMSQLFSQLELILSDTSSVRTVSLNEKIHLIDIMLDGYTITKQDVHFLESQLSTSKTKDFLLIYLSSLLKICLDDTVWIFSFSFMTNSRFLCTSILSSS